MVQDTRSIFYGILVNKKQIKSSEKINYLKKSITLAVYLKVAAGNVKYILIIDMLVN